MSNLTCKDFERLLDEYDDDSLNKVGRVSCELHLGTCSDCQDLLSTWRAFRTGVGKVAPPKIPPLVERAMVVEALSGTVKSAPKKQLLKRHPALLPAAVALAASIILVLFVSSQYLNVTSESDDPKPTNLAANEAGASNNTAEKREPKIAAIPSRSLLEINQDIHLWVRSGTEVRVERNDSKESRFFLTHGHVVAEINKRQPGYRFIIRTPRGQVEATGTVFSVEVEKNWRSETRVLRGSVKVEQTNSESKNFPSYSLRAGQSGVIGDKGPVEADISAIERDRCLLSGCLPEGESNFAQTEVVLVEIGPDGKLDGTVATNNRPERKPENALATNTIETEDSEEKSVANPQAPTSAEAKDVKEPNRTKKEETTVKALIKKALGHRKSGDYQEAAKIYREVIDSYKKTESTLSCHVSLGQLELLELGRPKVAASHFKQYLKHSPNGFLSEEARFGLVKAFGKIRDQKATLLACLDYIHHHPKGYASVQVLETQIKIYLTRADCVSAMGTAALLDESWPTGASSKRINSALQNCASPNPVD